MEVFYSFFSPTCRDQTGQRPANQNDSYAILVRLQGSFARGATLLQLFRANNDAVELHCRLVRLPADDDGKRFIVSVDDKLTAFLELERVTHESAGDFKE